MIVDRIDPCPSCGRVHGRVSWDGTERRAPEPETSVWRFAILIVVALLMYGGIGAALVWMATR